MAYFNRDKIYEALDGITVAEKLGLDVSNHGRLEILCTNLDHDDTHKNNCVLNKRGHYCFVCDRQTNLEGMVMNVCGIDYQKALEALAGWAGIAPEKKAADIKPVNKPPLSQKEIEELNLDLETPHAVADITSYGNYRTKETRERDIAGYYLNGENCNFSLKRLWEEDPDTYRVIMNGKIMERIHVIIESGYLYSSKEGKEFLKMTGTSYSAMKRVLNQEAARLIAAREKLYAM